MHLLAVLGIVVLCSISLSIYRLGKTELLRRSFPQFSEKLTVSDRSFIDTATHHVDLVYLVVLSTFNNSADITANREAMHANAVLLSRFLGKVYGEESQQQFLTIQSAFDQALIDYAQGEKVDNMEMKGTALSSLTRSPKAFSDYFSSQNSAISGDLLTVVYTDFTATIKTSIDSYGVGDYANALKQKKLARDHMQKIATAIINLIAAQKPEVFQ